MTYPAKSQIFGVLGFPVRHSFSPAMQNAAFSYLNIPAQYKLFEVKPDSLEDFLGHLDNEGISGLNVTVPYKENALRFAKIDSQYSYLNLVKAVNTLVKCGNIWKGFNTDILGFSQHLSEQFDAKNKRVAIIGAGGASRAVVFALASLGVLEISIFDIDKTKADNVSQMLRQAFPDLRLNSAEKIDQLNISQKDLLVNCTPQGMKPADLSPVAKEHIHSDLFVYDLIYNPPETKLILLAKEKGCRCSNGLGMLLYQGAKSFEYFTGRSAPLEVMRRALEEEIKKI